VTVRADAPGAARTWTGRRARRLLASAALAVLVAVGGGAWWAVSRDGAHPGVGGANSGSPTAHGSAPALPADPRAEVHQAAPTLGAYVGPASLETARAVDRQLGWRVTYVLDFLPKVTWASMLDITWLVKAWAGSGFHVVLGVPMLPSGGATLEQGAAGAYDGQFTELATKLVEGGLADATLMVGWQPDDPGNTWYVSSAAAAREYVGYWRRIHAAMESVPGSRFTFEWDAGDAGTSPVSPPAMYPGNAVVDLVATDAFDTAAPGSAPASQWPGVLDEPYGPAWMRSFALAHHEPMAIAMAAEVPRDAHGSGDDPTYLAGLLSWAASSHLRYCMLWDYGPSTLTGGGFPESLAVLQRAIASEGTPAS